jgi:hypothetical protein
MSIGPMGGTPANAAGVPLAQTKGSEIDRAQQEVAARQRQSYYSEKADAAAGVGETDGEDHETAERDADGRLLWEPPDESTPAEKHVPPKSKDPTGQSGSFLDLTG